MPGSDPQPITQHVCCASCGCPVTLMMSTWTATTNPDGSWIIDPDAHQPRWRCPDCKEMNEGGFPGWLSYVIKGYGPVS
ncbi:MAG: hypothetical protein ABI051_03365 [Vicinamibacterales bacterium]